MIILQWIGDFLRDILTDGIMDNFAGLFTNVSNQVGEVASQVGTSPAAWNAGVFNLIRQLSETVILPIAGLILTFVMCYELISMFIEKNNLNDLDTWVFFKWVFKTFVAVMILSNTFNIVMAVFDVAQSVIASSAGLVTSTADVTPGNLAQLETTLQGMSLGALFGLWFQSIFIGITVHALNIVIFVIVYGRMIQIYLMTSLAPIPFATVVNKEIGQVGHNYFKSLLAVAFQGFLILVCIAIYAVLVQSIATSGDPIGAVWAVLGYTVLLCFALFKTGSLAQSIFSAH
jgi:hypothetical protein